MSESRLPSVDSVTGPSVLTDPPRTADGPHLSAMFWPFAELTVCAKCGGDVESRYAVAVVNGGNLAGLAHQECPE